MNIHLPFVDATAPIQADRILRIETPLGTDVMLPERFELTETIGGFGGEGQKVTEAGLFTGRIAVRSPRHDIAANELVGRMVDVSVELSAEPPVRRTWHCLVSELLVGPPVTRGMRSYRLTLRPAHWLLTRRKDCRIWQNVSSVDVARTLLSEHGLSAPVTDGVITPPPPQTYSVQMNESDWTYMCRRLEQDGLWWFARHEGGAKDSVSATCDLHIASDICGYTRSDYDDGRVRYAAGSTDRNHITRFDTAFSFVPGARAGADWNFLTPGTVPGAGTSIPSLVDLPGGALGSNHNYESFEYPAVGGYGTGEGADGASEGITDAELDRVERLRAQAHEADHAQVVGEGTVRTLAPGQRFTPYDVPTEMGLAELSGSAADGATNFDEHVVLSITHRAVDQSYETQGGDPEYECTFTALPASTPATPHRHTPRPRIDGQQIALVAGPEGEEIHTDRFGRIKLWFPWDRRAAKDGTDTCWVRVGQSWAGTGWGAQVIPRIGMEVIVSYLDGDPDRPIVTGVVPNPRQKVPYSLPANKTKSVFRTQSHKQSGFNELTFEDAGGNEEIYLHAQKDHTLHIENNRAKRVDVNQSESVGHNKSIEIGNNHEEVVGGNVHLVVGANRLSGFVSKVHARFGNALMDKASKVLASANLLGASGAGGLGKGNMTVNIGGNKAETTAVTSTETVGVNKASIVGGTRQDFTGGSSHTFAGQHRMDEVLRTLTQVAGERWQAGSGTTAIVLDAASGKITITADDIELEGRSSIKLKAPKIDLN